MDKRIGVIGIVVESKENIHRLNAILSEYSHCIIGRMGVPYKKMDISIISIIVDGNTNEIGALTGQLGNLHGINVKSALTRVFTD